MKKNKHKKLRKFLIAYIIVFIVLFIGFQTMATEGEVPLDANDRPFMIGLTLDTGTDEGNLAGTLQMLFVITVISLAPSILVMMTSFTRIIVVLHFVRTAMGTQSAPPNNVLIGLALFLTFFIMNPVITKINEEGIQPLSRGEISQEEGIEACMAPLREFMLANAKVEDINFFLDVAKIEDVELVEDIPNSVVIPAFIIGELRASFIIGFLIYIPFIVIDMVVASTLMAMGMMMLPPTMISMPFKILLFVMADGWNLVIGQVVKTFIV